MNYTYMVFGIYQTSTKCQKNKKINSPFTCYLALLPSSECIQDLGYIYFTCQFSIKPTPKLSGSKQYECILFYDSGNGQDGSSGLIHDRSAGNQTLWEQLGCQAPSPCGLSWRLLPDTVAPGKGSTCTGAEAARPPEVQALDFAQHHFYHIPRVKQVSGPVSF